MKKFNTIGVLTSGGDAPGMNCAVRAITRRALANGLNVKGIIGGYSGLIKGEIIDMDARSVSNIENLGGTVAEALVNRGMISTPLDLFSLTVEQLGALNLGTDDEPRRFGEKNAAKALAALDAARNLPLERWLTAFGIPTIGTVTARTAANYHRNLAELAA